MVKTLIKWHGGKRYLANQIIALLPPHRIYVEPYGGGASVLLNKLPVDVEVYNDLDGRLARLFSVLRDQGAEFCRRMQLMPYSEAEFNNAVEAFINYDDDEPMDAAIKDFVRWRQSFGGRGHSWSFTTKRARGNMAGDVNAWWSAVDGLGDVVIRLKRVQIFDRPAVKVIEKFSDADAVIYCDPPYVTSSRTSKDVYEYEMSDEDHVVLSEALHKSASFVVLSGYASPLYDRLYRNWRTHKIEIANHAAGGKQKRRNVECLWMNFNENGKRL